MAESAARLLHLLGLLQRRPGLSRRELAEDLEVTERTLRRDMDRLRCLGYAIEPATALAAAVTLLGPAAALEAI